MLVVIILVLQLSNLIHDLNQLLLLVQQLTLHLKLS